MKNMLSLIVVLSSWLAVYSQGSYTEIELKLKCDSIIEESNTLYRYETAAWNFTDMFLAKPETNGNNTRCPDLSTGRYH